MPTVATFEIEYLQYLGPDGTLVRQDVPEFAQDLRNLVDLFKHMLLTRAFDAKAVALQRTGKLGTYASCLAMKPPISASAARCTTTTCSRRVIVNTARSSCAASKDATC